MNRGPEAGEVWDCYGLLVVVLSSEPRLGLWRTMVLQESSQTLGPRYKPGEVIPFPLDNAHWRRFTF